MEPRGFGPRSNLGISGSDARQETVKKRTSGRRRRGRPRGRSKGPGALRGGPAVAIGLVSSRSLRRMAATLAAALAVAACSSNVTTPTPAPIPRPLPRTRSRSTGPSPRTSPGSVASRSRERADPQVIDAEQLLENFTAEFDESNPEELVLLGERVYKALGLLAEDASLRDIYLELQSSQVIGYYDSEADELFIVSRSCPAGQPCDLGPLERMTYAHEFTHELQDNAFDLESLGLEEAVDEGDQALGILSLVEGDAVSAQTAWMAEHLSPAELAEVAAQASTPEMLAVLARTPAILLEISLFPYQAGAAFVNALLGPGGYDAVNAAYDDLPVSTEQVLHPEKYVAGEVPVDVAIPDDLAPQFGGGWTLDTQDTLGELQLRVWLREGGLLGDGARVATEGWGGDRIALLAAPDGAGDVVVISTAWDSAADAAEFRDAATTVVAALGRGGSVVIRDQRVVVAIGAPGPKGASLDVILVGLATNP